VRITVAIIQLCVAVVLVLTAGLSAMGQSKVALYYRAYSRTISATSDTERVLVHPPSPEHFAQAVANDNAIGVKYADFIFLLSIVLLLISVIQLRRSWKRRREKPNTA
jgi:hypothetical protein